VRRLGDLAVAGRWPAAVAEGSSRGNEAAQRREKEGLAVEEELPVWRFMEELLGDREHEQERMGGWEQVGGRLKEGLDFLNTVQGRMGARW
jgi:hypothetical protein